MAKIDIKSAYHIIPVSPSDRQLLGIRWHNEYYIDTRLPFSVVNHSLVAKYVENNMVFINANTSWLNCI